VIYISKKAWFGAYTVGAGYKTSCKHNWSWRECFRCLT